MLKVMVADDHRVVREGLKRIIEQSKDMQVVLEAADGAEVLAKVGKAKLDVVVLDISMPGRNGLDVLKQLKTKYPKLPILILSQHPEDQYALRALRAGASGYVTKDSAGDELVNAIRKVAGGRKIVTESQAEELVTNLGKKDGELPHKSLSDREYEILCLFGEGKTASHIAEELALSVKTISTYRTRILEKMKMSTSSELIRYAISNKLSSSEASSL